MIKKKRDAIKPKILVIDDNKVDLKLSSLMLEQNGFEVTAVNEATNCLENIEANKIDLVLLDIVMPETDGHYVLKMIRAKYSQIELPIIMVTSKSSTSDIVEALKLGANDYIVKPVNFEIAIRRIKTHLTLAEQVKESTHSAGDIVSKKML